MFASTWRRSDLARHVKIREKNLYLLTLLFSLPNIYMQVRAGGMVVGDAMANVALATPSPAWLGSGNTTLSAWCGIYIAPWSSHLGIASPAGLGSVAPAWLDSDIAP
jgi:hypothetical protein